MNIQAPVAPSFDAFGLSEPLLSALRDAGYVSPTPIQIETIPPLLAGRDVVGQAQTGTGKTAAFALPLLAGIDASRASPQVLVLTPTRELAVQVAAAFERYAAHLENLRVLAVYGGQEYGGQIRALRRGAHVVVGTPGRIMDHMRRQRLVLDELRAVVLDEADEMLQMGFVEDIEWVLRESPPARQTALFSATIPAPIRRIAEQHLREPVEITVGQRSAPAVTIRQRYWIADDAHKLDALSRFLETEPVDGALVFVRTKAVTTTLAASLATRGIVCAPLNGDVPQSQREATVEDLKRGKIDVIVATDVAARGLDVERVSHVFNYDMPGDAASYVHRIGRTGRAGRAGDAISFVTRRELPKLRSLERGVGGRLIETELPPIHAVNARRVERFMDRITSAREAGGLTTFTELVERYRVETGASAMEIAAALARLVQGDTPLLVSEPTHRRRGARPTRPAASRKPERRGRLPGVAFEPYRVEVGRAHGVEPGNLVGAIANVADLDRRYIGRIDIREEWSIVDLPVDMPDPVRRTLGKVWVSGRQLRMTRCTGRPRPSRPERGRDRGPREGGFRKPTRKPRGAPGRAPEGHQADGSRSGRPRRDRAPERSRSDRARGERLRRPDDRRWGR